MPSEVMLKNFEIYKKKQDSCINNHSPKIFPVSKIFSLCYSKIPCVFCLERVRTKFPVFLSHAHPILKYIISYQVYKIPKEFHIDIIIN